MAIGDFVKKVGDALDSDQGEKITDAGLDAAASAAKKATGGKFGDQIAQARDAADEKVGKRTTGA